MMDPLKLFAVAVSYLIVFLPAAGATQVNIVFNGVVEDTTSISPENAVSMQVNPICESTDPTCSKPKLQVIINAASLAHSVNQINLFFCKLDDPTSCSQTTPQVYFSFVNEEFLWSTVSEQESGAFYPQTAKIMALVELEDGSSQTSWASLWFEVVRTNFNQFTVSNPDLDQMEVHATSSDLIGPIKNFIENFHMVPFNWATRVTFQTASSLEAIGGDDDEISTPVLTSAIIPGNQVTSINKDFFFVFSDTIGGITNGITLHDNPSFTCGDNKCDLTLGESPTLCCFDCGCDSGYCDNPNDPDAGVCKDDSLISLSVTPPSVTATNCLAPLQIDLPVQILNPPASLPPTISGIATIGGSPQTVSCSGDGIFYTCPVTTPSSVSCGSSSLLVGPNSLNLTLIYSDGPNQVTNLLSQDFGDIPITLNCPCQDGFFCDAGTLTCNSEASLTLSITSVTSFLPDFDSAGDTVTIEAKINNPPTDLAVTGVTFTLGKLFKGSTEILNSTTGSITCSVSGTHEYLCDIPVSIPSYDHTEAYFFKGNSITFSTEFSDVGVTVTKDLVSAFSDITIPSFQCGDGVCNVEESQETCCTDCGCPAAGMYCDVNFQSCGVIDDVTLQVLSVDPVTLTDCSPDTPHTISIQAQVTAPPSDLSLLTFFYIENGVVQTHPFSCQAVNPGAGTGLFNCDLTLAPLANCQDQPGGFMLGPNTLNFTVSFSDGALGKVTKSLSAGFHDITVTPIFTSGDGICETILGESAANSCVDCPCEDEFGAGFFCNIPEPGDPGTCKDIQDIQLVIDSPTAPVSFDSCEVSQQLDITAHIENQPANIVSQIFTATLDGENAELFSCFSSALPVAGNSSGPIDCTLTIPPEDTCSLQDPTIQYDPNSITLTLIFASGPGETEIHTTTAPLPTITTTQQIRSIFDITQESIAKMEVELEKTQDIADSLLSTIETCFDVAIVLAIASIVAMVGGAFAGAKATTGLTWQEGMQTGAIAGQTLLSAWTSLCQMLSTLHQAQLKVQEIRLQFIQSETCMDIVQHQIDAGQCENNEASCFTEMSSCLNFANIDAAFGSLQNSLSQFNSFADDFGDALVEGAEALEVFGGGSASLDLKYNNQFFPNTGPGGDFGACNRHPQSVPRSSYAKEDCQNPATDDDVINVQVFGTSSCKWPAVYVTQSTPPLSIPTTPTEVCNGNSCSNDVSPIDTINTQETLLEFLLYCFGSQQTYANSVPRIKDTSLDPIGRQKVYVYVDENGDCFCNDQDGIVQPTQPTNPLTLSSDKTSIQPGETVSFTAQFNPPPGWTLASGNILYVDFMDGTSDQRTFTTAPFTGPDAAPFIHQFSSAGSYDVTALIPDPNNPEFTSNPVTITVASPNPPTVTTSPQNGAVGVSPAGPFIITFSQSMDTNSVTVTDSVEGEFYPTPSSFTIGTWDSNVQILTIEPVGIGVLLWQPGSHTITIDGSSSAGVAMAQQQITISV